MLHSGSFLGCVDLANIICWFKCPFTVAVDFDKCFSTACSVRPGQDAKFPFFISFIHIDFTGLNAVACRSFCCLACVPYRKGCFIFFGDFAGGIVSDGMACVSTI
jgi:hypothetical protein